MVRHLLATTALVAGLSAAAWGEDASQQPASDVTMPPAAAPQDQPQGEATETGQPAAAPEEQPQGGTMETGQPAATEDQPEGGTTEAGQPAATPEEQPQGGALDTSQQPAAPTDSTAVGRATPGDAVIPAQPDTHLRAEELIGMTVVSADGKSVGSVSDLILDDQQKLSGIVVGMGGFLGIGERAVGINWSQAEVRPDDSGKEQIFVNLTKDDLDKAPDFKTKEQVKSESEAAAQSQSQMPAPAAGGGTMQ